MDNQQEVSILELVKLLWSNVLWIILAGIIACVGSFCITKYCVDPVYTASAGYLVWVPEKATTTPEQSSILSSSQLATSLKFADTCKVLVEDSNNLKERVVSYIGEHYPEYQNIDGKQLGRMVEVSILKETLNMEISAKCNDPKLAKVVAEAYSKVVPSEIANITGLNCISVYRDAVEPTSPISPRPVRNAILGFVIGAVLNAMIIIIRWFCDTTVYTSEDLKKVTSVPVLGSIPEFLVEEKTDSTKWTIKEGGRDLNEKKSC